MGVKLQNIVIDCIKNLISQLNNKLFHKGYNNTNIRSDKIDNTDKDVDSTKNTENEVEIIEFFKKKYHYTIQPHEHYIYNNIDNLFKKVQTFFKNKNYIPTIGIEIEFYLINSNINIGEFYKKIYNFTEKNNIDVYKIEQERGSGQFEIKFSPYQNIEKLVTDYNILKDFLLNNFDITFCDFPFKNDSGSALQININLVDANTQKNLFSRNEDKTQESCLLLNSVAGLLKTTNLFLPFYLSKTKNTDRLNEYINVLLYKNGKIPAPTYNSWGINNRTCSIRIPIPKNIYQFNNYFISDDNNRRIEFRVPSSDADIKFVLYCVLNAVAFGIKNNLQPVDATYNNLLLNHEGYEKIELLDYEFEDVVDVIMCCD